jgi:UDP-GlcNAc3NAcA epimerase
LRDETEWVELVEIGANVLVGFDFDRISQALTVNDNTVRVTGMYGSGYSAQAIIGLIQNYSELLRQARS